MVSMQDYMNTVKNSSKSNFADFANHTKSQSSDSVPNIASNLTLKNDSFEKENIKIDTNSNKNLNKKIDKKKIFKIGAIVAGIGLAILAFLKRKQISCMLSNLFNKKKPPEPPIPPSGNIPNPKTPPATPPTKPTIKPIQDAGSKVQPSIDTTKSTEQVNQGIQENVGKIGKEIPKPVFKNIDSPTIEERKQYLESIAIYMQNQDRSLVNQAIDAINKYGTAEDIDKLHTIAWMYADEPTLVKLVKTTAKLGRLDKGDDTKLQSYITTRNHDLSNETYIEIFKALNKLVSGYGSGYEDLVRFLNKIPTDKNGEFTKVLTETLINLGNEASAKYLDKYKINFNHVNEFMNKGQKTPQAVLDVVDKVRVGLKSKI